MVNISEYKALWAAVLEQAIKDINKKYFDRTSKNIVIEIEGNRRSSKFWFNRKNEDCVGSFIWVCDLLEIDPGKTKNIIFGKNGMNV